MRDLFKAELLRFRGWALGAFAVHLLVLLFFTRMVDLAQQPVFVYRVAGGVDVLAGLLLGLYQMGSYRRPNVWLNLLHRPLAPGRIATALLGAGLAWLAVAVALPVLLAAAYQAGLTARVVDLRHWLLPLAAWALAACGYLAGACCMLGRPRSTAAALVLLLVPVASQATGAWALLMQAAALAWLAAMAAVAFKPDLSAPPRSVTATVLLALPLQVAVYVAIIVVVQVGAQVIWMVQGTHPNNTDTPPRGGQNETERMAPQQRMLAGLAVSTAPEAPLWREQVALSDVVSIAPDLDAVPVRGALTNAAPVDFDDAAQGVRWTFGHDRMRLVGYRIAGGRAAGVLGVGAANAAFPAPTVATSGLPGQPKEDRSLLAGNMLYHYVSETGRVFPRIQLPSGEWLLGTAPVGENLVALSNRALYFFDGRDVMASESLLTPRQRMPVPGGPGGLHNLELIELVDGYLISNAFTNYDYTMAGAAPYQTVTWVHDDGRVTLAARRAIVFDYPAWFRYQSWWPSPALHALRQGVTGLFAAPDPMQVTQLAPRPRSIQWLAGALMLAALLAALRLLRRRPLPLPAQVAWVAACGLIGLPALASLWLLYPACESSPARLLPASNPA
jgi:hypothetical protein